MASKKVWFMRDAILAIGAAIGTVSTTSTLATQFSALSTWTSRIKDLRLSLGARDVGKIDVMGLQQLLDEMRPEMVELNFKVVYYPGGEPAASTTLYSFLFGQGFAVGATGYNRYQGGEKATGERSQMAALITTNRPAGTSVDTAVILMNNSIVTHGPISADASSSFEEEWTIKCLAADVYIDTGVAANPNT